MLTILQLVITIGSVVIDEETQTNLAFIISFEKYRVCFSVVWYKIECCSNKKKWNTVPLACHS